MNNTNNQNINALQQIQAELKAPKSKTNTFGKYNYRNCEDILEAVKPLLQKYDASLIITDEVQEVAGVVVVTAKVIFTDASGKETVVKAHAGVEINKKGMDVAQTFGASSSYARKYALNGLFLIDDTKDYDSDEYHNQVNHAAQSNNTKSNSRQAQQSNSNQNSQSNGQQQRPLAQRYNDALGAIKGAKKPQTLDKAINTFANTQFDASIRRACKARADQMGWFEAPPVNQVQQQNQVQH
ncbi:MULTISPECIES: ERF family protein [unclassified Acinetobacter]|uniref:ERF family protein n=1 Tax=unclassified Acinetobacter TaxID=196816 RepID=UPI001022AC91|nr:MULTISPECIES: ERF family protein [unclassified Acinetobacter]RZG71841.1 Essential recombination function protein [Acinetobacter sp. WCHAc060025]RZG76832.1 Essential recombination function protein [Acinetobacter sp. WCHAc060033]